MSLLSDPGWQKNTTYSQYSGNLNANYNLSSKFALNVITDLSYRSQSTPTIAGTTLYNYALTRPRFLDPKEHYKYRYTPFNALEEMNNSYTDTNVATLRLQAQLTYKITLKNRIIL